MSTKRFHEQVWPLRDRLYRIALRLLGEQATAEDMVQESLIKIWEKRAELGHIQQPAAWCMRIVRNRCIDWLRSPKRLLSGELAAAHYLPDQQADPLALLERKDQMSLIAAALAALAPQRRQVVELREIEGLSYQEIAEIMGISLDQVRTDLHRGRLQLRQLLQTEKTSQQHKP